MRFARIGILGAGALGSLFAYFLASRTRSELWLLTRTALPGEVVVEGLGRTTVRVSTNPREPVDLLLVMVKAYATAQALRWAAPAIGPDTLALTLQNGLGNAEALAAAVGAERTLAGVTAQGATLLSPGVVRHGGQGLTLFAPWVPVGRAAGAARAVADLLTQAGLAARAEPDPQPLLWGKLAVNCGINPLSAILRVTNGELLRRPGARRLLEAAAREAGSVAEALGVPLGFDPALQAVQVAQDTAANRSSMLQDLERGRRTEIEAISGALVERARTAGLHTPVNEALADLVRALEVEA